MRAFLTKYKDIVFLFTLSLVTLTWYGFDSNKLIASHDVGYPFNPLELFKSVIYAWFSAGNFGLDRQGAVGTNLYHGTEALLSFLAGSTFLGQKIYVIIWFFVPMFSMYLLLNSLSVFRNRRYMALLASVLFAFNHFQLGGWGVLWRARFATYASLPLLFLVFVDYLEDRRGLIRSAIYTGLIFFFLNGGGSPPVFGTPLMLIAVTGLYFLIINYKKNFIQTIKKIVAFCFVSGLVTFILSAFWFIPYINFAYGAYNKTLEAGGGPTAVMNWADVVSSNSSILNLLRLQGIPGWTMAEIPVDSYLKVYFTNPIVVALFFIWPLLAFSAVILGKRRIEKKYLLLLALLSVVSLIFSAGSHEPFREFYLFLLKNVPGFPIFRTPFYKFANLLWFSYSILIAFSFSALIEKSANFLHRHNFQVIKLTRIITIVIILFIMIWDFPIFGERIFHWRPNLSTIEKVPQYVIDYGKWMDQRGDFNYRTLLLPDLNDMWHAEVFDWGYWSLSTVTSMLTRKNTLSNDSSLIGAEPYLVKSMYKSLRESDPIWIKLARLLDIKYFLLRKDFFHNLDWVPALSPSVYEKVLQDSDQVKKIETFGKWEFYSIQNTSSYNKIHIPIEKIFYSGKDEDIPKFVSFLDKTGNYPAFDFMIMSEEYSDIFDGNNRDLFIIPGPVNTLLPVEHGSLILPKPKFLPGSPLYFMVEYKEKEQINKTSNLNDKINLLIGLSLKRLGELKELIAVNSDLNDIKKQLNKYGIILGEIRKNINVEDKSSDSTYNLLRVKAFFKEERNFFANLINNEKNTFFQASFEESYKSLSDLIFSLSSIDTQDNIISDFDKGYFDDNTVILTKDYFWKVPFTAEYDVYIDNSSVLANSKELVLNVTSQNKSTSQEQAEVIRSIKVSPNDQLQPSQNMQNNYLSWQKIGSLELSQGIYGLSIFSDDIHTLSFKRGDIILYAQNKQKTATLNDTSTNSITQKNVISNYIRVNPTRFKVEVFSDNKPFALAFNERFDPGWKIYIKEKSKDKKTNLGLFDNLWKILDNNIFNTLWLKPLPEENHLKINGYANAWQINNIATKGQKTTNGNNASTYEIIIEYWPQRLLWLGYIITFVSLPMAFLYLVLRRK